jgi:ribose transport system permease protein
MSTSSATTRGSAFLRAGVTPRRVAVRHGWTIGVYLLLAAVLIVDIVVAPVFTAFDLQSLVIATLPLAFAAMAQSVIVISGGIDLSIGAQMALVNVIAAKSMHGHGFGTALLIVLALMLLGAVIGAITGSLIVATGVPDIVVTLAMSFVWAGVALIVLPEPGGGSPQTFQDLSQTSFVSAWLPSGVVVLVVVLLALWLPLRWRRPGYALYAIGSNRNAAYLSGVRIGRTRILAYALGSVFAALGGLALTSTTGIGSPASGEYYTLNSVAAVVLGGVSLVGGKGGLVGPIAAAFVLSILVSIMTFLGIDPNYAQVVQGSLIVIVVMLGGLVLLRRKA